MVKDFTAWARPDLHLTLGGREYTSRPPAFGEVDLLLAIAVRVELQVGLAQGDLPPELAQLLQENGDRTVAEVSLGTETLAALRADKVAEETITRMGLYAALYWARGEAQADTVAELAWGQGEQVADEAPKGPRRSKSGPSTASESPTNSASTPTTGPRDTSSRQRRGRSRKPTETP